MRLPRGVLADPGSDQGDLFRAELLVALGRRHDFLRIPGDESLIELALLRVPPDHHGRCIFPFRKESRLGIEAHVGLARAGIGAVAGKAVLGQNRADVAIELYLWLAVDRWGGCGQEEEDGGGSNTHESLPLSSTENSR